MNDSPGYWREPRGRLTALTGYRHGLLAGYWEGDTGEALGIQWPAAASPRTRRNNTDSMPMYAPINMYPTTASEAANNLASGGGRTPPYPSVVHVTMEKYRQVIGSRVTFSPSIGQHNGKRGRMSLL
jgi:hypothetical protein